MIDRPSPGLGVDEWAVLDQTGQPAGWLSPIEFGAAGASGADPILPLGSGTIPIKGFQVYDKAGRHVGYEVIALGFFTLAEAADAARMDRLIAENEAAEQEAYERFHPEFVERFGE